MTVQTPIETRSRGIPAWALWLTVFVLLVGGVYAATNLSGENPSVIGGVSPSPGASGGVDVAAAQALIQQAGCQGCHGQDLTGSGNFPDLHGVGNGPKSQNLQQLATDHPDNWIHLWIQGTDPAVADLDRGGMPVFGGAPYNLTDEQIDTIVAYLKTLP